jgi:hypothetical protein
VNRHLPTFGVFIEQALAAAQRFPLVLICGAAAAAAAILAINAGGDEMLYARAMATATLGLPLCFGLAVTAELRRPGWRAQAIAGLIAVVILGAFYLVWPSLSDTVRWLRYTQLSVAFHLAVAVLPFLGRDLPHAFWQYNRRLLQRFLLSAVFSGVIFLGLALALAAVHELLGVDVTGESYGRLWVTVAFVVNTWIFIAGAPSDLAALEQERDFPKALKVLAQRILVPLVSLYVIILTLYLGRVIVSHDWPRGWIGYLVSGLAVTGILALLLVHPISDQPEERWVMTFARGFWFALLPSIVMLWLAIEQRVRQYGVTEPRYFLIVLSAWLFGIALFYALRRSRDMRVIPASLSLVAVVTLAGPWSAFSFSERSQLGRLTALLQKNDMLAQGHVRPASRSVVADDEREISATIEYLTGTHGKTAIAPLFAGSALNLDTLVKAESPSTSTTRVVKALGLEYRRGGGNTVRSISYYAGAQWPAARITGFDVLISVRNGNASPADTGYAARLATDRGAVQVLHNRLVLVEIPLDSLVAQALRMQGMESKARVPLYADATGQGGAARLRVTGMYGQGITARSVSSLTGEILLRLPSAPRR